MAERAAPGWVYVLTHPAWDKLGMVKIGKTGRDSGTCAAEIAAVSGLLAPCTIAWCAPVADMAAAETAVHRMLDRQRVGKRRELFRVDVATARQVVQTVSGATGLDASALVTLSAPGDDAGAFRRLSASWLVAAGALLILLRPLLVP